MPFTNSHSPRPPQPAPSSPRSRGAMGAGAGAASASTSHAGYNHHSNSMPMPTASSSSSSSASPIYPTSKSTLSSSPAAATPTTAGFRQDSSSSSSSSAAVDYARFAPPTSSNSNSTSTSNLSASNPPSRQGSSSGSASGIGADAATDSLEDHPEPNFAGRGAGRNSQNLGAGMALPPINTHLQPQFSPRDGVFSAALVASPQQQQQQQQNHQQSQQHYHQQQQPPLSASSSNGSPRMSFLSRSLHAAPPPPPPPAAPAAGAVSDAGVRTRPGRSGSTSSFSASHSAPPLASGSSSARTRSPSSREPLFPPSKSNSNSSSASAGTSHSQRSQRSPTSASHLPLPSLGSSTSTTPKTSSSSNPSSDGPSDLGAGGEGGGGRLEREPRRERSGGQTCAKCDLPMTGQFVRALGTVYHLDCFRCMDCNKVVANKFFPIDAPDASSKQVPLCETDYFRRLDLLCQKCGQALRGSYITALDMKFHVEHFTCSVCPTVFGPQDSYYEHAGSVYCHFHYSTRFAVKCTGCRTAILKQFVEINRNSVDEHWHPECYMINKFWNIKLAPSPPIKAIEPASEVSSSSASDTVSKPIESPSTATGPPSQALDATEYLAQEETETPASLKARQKLMEEQVYRIWTVLSAFEESSAACISEMLRHVSSGHYIDGVRMAEKFVVHVETLFSAIDDLSVQFKQAGTKEISHVREARMLCKKVVNFFSLLSHTHETGARKMSITQELLSLVTGLAHYLKILIRIALTAALKLEREFDNRTAIGQFLSRLDQLAHDPDSSTKISPASSLDLHGAPRATSLGLPTPTNGHMPSGLKGSTLSGTSRTYGYKSLTRPDGSTLVGQGEATTDLCEGCHLTVEEECARFGTSHRWHLPCLRCKSCGKSASRDRPTTSEELSENVWWPDFRVEVVGDGPLRIKGAETFCRDCVTTGRPGSDAEMRQGFDYVTRLEQYAFLLCVALNKLYALLKHRGVVPSSPNEDDLGDDRSLYDTYRDSTDIKRMKSVNLDRKLSSTTARIPKRSVVVQSPSGRVAHPNDTTIPLFTGKPPVPSRKDQPLIDPVRGTTMPRPPPIPALASTSQHRSLDASSLASSNAPSTASSSSTATAVPATPTAAAPSSAPASAPARPTYNRATTAIQIVDEQAGDQAVQEPEPVLGDSSEPTQDEEGITLADLPTVMEAEQKREQRRYQPTRPVVTSAPLLSELSALEYLIVRHIAALLIITDAPNAAFSLRDVISLDDLLEIIDERKNTFWGKLFKGGKEKKVEKKKGVFGVPIEVLVERNGVDSMHGAGPGSLRIPSFVDDVISAMKQMDMSIEGIFRKNGNIRRLKDLSEALDRDSASVNLSDDNPVQIAALLKRFLRDLPDPLIPFKLFQLFIATQRIENAEDRKRAMHLCCCLLPKCHRDTLEALFVFLKWVASFSHVDEETGSKMDLLNLATVVSPNILYSKGKDPARDESFSSVRAVHELLEWQDDLWQVPHDFVSILHDQEFFNNPSQLTSKEILARADQHVRSAARKGSLPTSQRNDVYPHRSELNTARSASSFTSSTGHGSRPMQLSNSGPGHPGPRGPGDRPMSYSNPQTPNGGLPMRAHPVQQSHLPSPVGSPPKHHGFSPVSGQPPLQPPHGGRSAAPSHDARRPPVDLGAPGR